MYTSKAELIRAIQERWADTRFRIRLGNTPMSRATLPKSPKLLGKSTKILKSNAKGYYSTILYMSPATESGVNLCPWASEGCAAACLGHSSGQLTFSTSKNARLWKSALYLYARGLFNALLRFEITAHIAKAESKSMIPSVRLNGATDCIDVRPFAKFFPECTFSEYTKSLDRMAEPRPDNYGLAFSRSETNHSEVVYALQHCLGSAAVVFDGPLPKEWHGFPVFDGDTDDLTVLDRPGTVRGLKLKGTKAALASAVATGFAVTAT